LKAAAIQFPLAHPAVTSLLVGPRSVAELEDNLALLRVDIPAALWDDLRAEGLLPQEAPTP
jgi:D-threo-aldose 1-dehydrogenase